MIDPVIFSFKLFDFTIALRWYGVLVMLGAVVGSFVAEREIKWRGENGEKIWDALVWILPMGIIGARLWYVLNSILGGSRYYIDAPIKIINIPEGGLHFFGGLLFGGIALYFFLKNNGMDLWLFLDAIAPAALIGQALARPANFINQELYGPPTKLPWGIPIEATHRLSQYADLSEATRFHPTFAYEIILNVLIALALLWIARRYKDEIKPGAIFAAWLTLAGLSRAFIELFRPDQPRIGASFVTYSMAASLLMALAGAALTLVRFGKLRLAFAENWEERYALASQTPKRTRSVNSVDADAEEALMESAEIKPVAKKSVERKEPAVKKPIKKAETSKLVSKKPKAKTKKVESKK
jgi:phosphatidylglycerol:prolipoprotein diacylglycerol transferase